MSIGLGIFLAASVMALVLLYNATKDRWSWPAIVRRAAIAVVAIVVAVVVIVGIYYAYDALISRPVAQSTYEDLKLGASMEEVQYIKGVPTNVAENAGVRGAVDKWGGMLMLPVKDFKENQHVEHYWRWSYDNPNGSRLDIEFDPQTKTLNRITCYSQGAMLCAPLFDLYDGSTEDELIAKLGHSSDQDFIGGNVKQMTYKSLRARFYLAKQHIYMLSIFR